MLFPILISFYIQQLGVAVSYHNPTTKSSTLAETDVTLERSRAFSLLFSSIQCFNATDPGTEELREINKNFNPEHFTHAYPDRNKLERLLKLVEQTQEQPEKLTEPFTAIAQANRNELGIILDVLFPIADRWSLFFNTSAWLLGRVNGGCLHWALTVITVESFTDSVVPPTTVEVFPQYYINKKEIASVAGIQVSEYGKETHPLSYYLMDPRLNEFHYNWHIESPVFWSHWNYPKMDRKGELFLYMHHQLVSRYNAERVSNGLPYVTSLELRPDYIFPTSYNPDILNINFKDFPIRYEGQTMKDYDDGTGLANLATLYGRLNEGTKVGIFLNDDGTSEYVGLDNNATDRVGGIITPFHNDLHKFLAGMAIEQRTTPGVTSHAETTFMDRVFYQLHQLIDDLYLNLKSRVVAYNALDLNYRDIEIVTVEIQTTPLPNGKNTAIPVLTTYFDWDTFDISTAARPCRGVGGAPAFVKVQTLRHHPFNYSITIRSTLSTKTYGMVRIFLLPEVDHEGRILSEDESQLNAIQLDLFPLEIPPNQTNTIVRSSTSSSVTRMPLPGIKALLNMTSPVPSGILGPDMKRSCGFPNNLLIPKGTEDGMGFKVFVMISDELEIPEEHLLPHFTYCGMLNGLPFPDKRSMGFPFDRTKAKFASHVTEWNGLYENVKLIPITIKHQSS